MASSRTSLSGRHERRLVGLEVFLAVGALAGAIGLVTGGIDLGRATDDLPWRSPVLGGIALGLLNGALPLAVAIAEVDRARWAPLGHLAVGLVLLAWIAVQVGFIGLGSWLQLAYGILGLVITVLAGRSLWQTPSATDAARRRRVRWVQRYVLNPPMKTATWLGLVPGHALVETRGRRSGKRRRTVVGIHVDGATAWVVAEQGRHAGYVRNLEADAHVRVRLRGRWRPATALVVDGDEPGSRLDAFARPHHAAAVRRFGTALAHDPPRPRRTRGLTAAVLWWIAVGAGGHVVRHTSRRWEQIDARAHRGHRSRSSTPPSRSRSTEAARRSR